MFTGMKQTAAKLIFGLLGFLGGLVFAKWTTQKQEFPEQAPEILTAMEGICLDWLKSPPIYFRGKIGWGRGDCAPRPFHTTGRAVFRIRRLIQAAVTCVPPSASMGG
jgi:hypothetical protein